MRHKIVAVQGLPGQGPSQPKLGGFSSTCLCNLQQGPSQTTKINEMGLLPNLAQDIGETLTSFYSVDKWKSTETGKSSKRSTKKHMTLCALQIKFQKVCRETVELPHSAHKKFILGKLSLCIGMPVMISTWGQQSAVWQMVQKLLLAGNHISLLKTEETLDTRWKLVNTPNHSAWWFAWKCGSISKHAMCVPCDLPKLTVLSECQRTSARCSPICNDWLCISRRTRPYNVVDMNNCWDQLQSMNFIKTRSALKELITLMQLILQLFISTTL